MHKYRSRKFPMDLSSMIPISTEMITIFGNHNVVNMIVASLWLIKSQIHLIISGKNFHTSKLYYNDGQTIRFIPINNGMEVKD